MSKHRLRDLYNQSNKHELKDKLKNETFKRCTLSFYRYVNIINPKDLRHEIFIKLNKIRILGRIYIAKEGINAQLSIPSNKLETLKNILNSYIELKNIDFKVAVQDSHNSFFKLTIKVKNQIVADGLNSKDFDINKTGMHIGAKEFNKAINDPNTVLIDMRNNYESEVGRFKGAICPDADTFKEELPIVKKLLKDSKDRQVVMYCTGGIRCEKASSYLIANGFKNVKQLHGGIIQYFHEVKNKNLENKFIGKNFVFDNRLGERITDDIISNCHICNSSCDEHRNCENQACHILFIQCNKCYNDYNGCCSKECMDFVNLPLNEQNRFKKKFINKSVVRPKIH